MGFNYGPSIVTDGLKLYLDKYNEQSYPGEPTTNVVHYTNLNTGWSKGYNTNIVFDELPPPIGIEKSSAHQTTVSFDDLLGGGGYWYSYGDHAPQDPSTTYTVSVYVQTVQSTPVSIQFYTADNSEVGRYISEAHYFTRDGETNSGGTVINNNIPDANGWIRIVWTTFTSTSNAQSDSLSFQFGGFNDPASAPNRTSLCAPQMEAKSHATKYVGNSANNGTVTTRPTADGWKDLSGNGNHGTFTDLTYSATNIPGTDRNNFSFSGTSYSGAFVGDSTGVGPYSADAMTIDAWVNLAVVPASQATSYPCIFSKRDVDTQRSYFFAFVKSSSVLYWEIKNSNGTYFIHSSTKTDWVADRWYHVAVTYHAQSGLSTMYIDGVEEAGSKSPSQPWTLNPIPSTTASTYVGRTHGGSYSFNGEIDIVKFYNRVLISTEVSQNFNAQKSRYGL